MAEDKRSVKAPEHGEVFDARFHQQLMIGPKQLPPGSECISGKHGWSLVVDEALRCVWVGWNEWVTRVPWDNVVYVRYRAADGRAPGESPTT